MRLRAAVVLCLVACGGGGGGGGDDAPAIDASMIDAPIDAPVGRSMIGPAGGAVASMDGIVTLTVPAGALTAETEITIDVVPQAMWPASIVPANPIGAVYAVGPEGTVFAVPATLTWQFAIAPAGSKDAMNRPKVLFGHGRSAADVIELHADTRAIHTAGALTVTSQLAHLSEHFLTAKAYGNTNVFFEIGSVSADLLGGMHAVGAEWTARKLELHPTDSTDNVMINIDRYPVAPVERAMTPGWDFLPGLDYRQENLMLRPGTPFAPTFLPKFKCTSVGMGEARLIFSVRATSFVSGTGAIEASEKVTCYDRVQKTEYTVEAGLLGMTRIAPLAVPATTTINLADHQGLYGHQVCLLPGQTITVCVGATMPTAVNYFPQYSPGFTFVDGPVGSGCVTLTNLDPNDSNCVLVKSEGGGSPNNVTVTTTVP